VNLSPYQKLSLAGIFLFAFGIPISFVPAEFGIAFALLGWLLEGLVRNHWQVRWHRFFIPLSIYIAWNIFSSAVSPRPLHSLWAVADNEWSLFIMVMMFWIVPDLRTLSRIVTVFLSVSGIAMVYGIWQTFGGVEYYRHEQLAPLGAYFRAVGFNGFYLTFAGFAMTVFFLAVSHTIEVRTKAGKWYGVLSVLSFLAVVASFARSIWLSLVVAIPASGFLRGRKQGFAVTAGLFILVGVTMLASAAIRSRLESIVDLPEHETRLNLWKTSIRIAEAFPITGIGEDNFDYYFEKYRVEGYYDVTGHPHSDYFNVLVNSGIPGFLSFLAMWWMAIRTGVRAWRGTRDASVRAAAAGGVFGIVGFLVGAFFQDYYGTFANCLGWWFVTGIVFTSSRFADSTGQMSV